MASPRDRYAEVGAALRASMGAAARARLTGSEWRVLSAIVAQTAGWSRISDRISHAQIAEFAGFHTGTGEPDTKRVSKVLRKLCRRDGVLGDYVPGTGYVAPDGVAMRIQSVVSLPRQEVNLGAKGGSNPVVRGVRSIRARGSYLTPYPR